MGFWDDDLTTTPEAAAQFEQHRSGGFYDEDARADALAEARADEYDDQLVKCMNGHRWNPGYHRATRWDPAYVEVDECPECHEPPEDQR